MRAVRRDFASLSERELADLDAMLAHEDRQRWRAFFADRHRPCPFFGAGPDESLVQWVDEGVIHSGRAIDLGCGNGRNAIYLARNGFSVEGVDYSDSALAWARERVAAAGVPVSLICRSVFELELSAGAYDLVYDSGCFHHVPPHRRHQYVSLVAHALRPGGWFGLACFKPEGGSGYSDAEVYERRSMGGGLGYTEERLREIWSGSMRIRLVRAMLEQSAGSAVFGRDFLWVLLAQKP
jgi:SAM-dependent methyltransferase